MGKQELQRVRSSMVNVQIGDRTYPAIRSNRCKVCMHPARALIEERLLLNETYPSIVDWVSNRDYEDLDGARIAWPVLNIDQLSKHYNHGHCPIDTRVLHELTEQRAVETGASYEAMTGRLVDHVVLAKFIATKGQERLAKGEIAPTVKETLAAAKLLHDIEADKSQGEIDRLQDYADAMAVYFEVVQRMVTAEQWQAIGAALAVNPVLKSIAQKMAEQDVEDAEIVA